ncbi:MAG: hypothetical protein JKY14_13635, partial [Paraglaciecola sp.]|nr:hypothetical protein [Paraglaciecola sp.]
VTKNLTPGNNKSGEILSNSNAYTTALANGPAAPTIEYLRENNGVSWKMSAEYDQVTHYEYTNDKGITWHQVVSNPQHVGHLAYAKTDVGIRVKASATGDAIAAGETVWASSYSKGYGTPYQFEEYAYTWRTQQRTTEALNVYGNWNKPDTSCMFDHNAAVPTYWVSIDYVYAGEFDEKFNHKLSQNSCGISNWQWLTPEQLILLSQGKSDTELANFNSSNKRFITKNSSDVTIIVQNGSEISSSSSATLLLKWQYPGIDVALATITPLVNKTQQQVIDDQASYDAARSDVDSLLSAYQAAKTVADYLAISADINSSKTSLDNGYTVMLTQQQIVEKDYYSALLLAQFVGTDPLASDAQKITATTAMNNISAALKAQNDRVAALAALQISLTNLSQTLSDIDIALTAQSTLTTATSTLVPFASSHPATLAALANAASGQAQHAQAMLSIEQLQLLQQHFAQATKQVDSYQLLLDALPSDFHSDALSELNQSRTALESALAPFDLSSLASDYQTIKAAFEAAYQAGYIIDLAQAKVGTHFAKLDIAGHNITSSATFNQGWRCVSDLRESGKNRVWALLHKGTVGSIDNVAYSGTAKSLTQAGGLQALYNSEAICGFGDWTIPTPNLLESLATVDYTSSKKPLMAQYFLIIKE